jgi:hypothetical protein
MIDLCTCVLIISKGKRTGTFLHIMELYLNDNRTYKPNSHIP